MIKFSLPALGADMDQGKLLEWRVRPGDAVRRGQVVAVVDTVKAAIDVECWHDGTIHALLAEPGTLLPVGAPLAVLREDGESAADVEAALAASAMSVVGPAPAAVFKEPAPTDRRAGLGVRAVPSEVTGGPRPRLSPYARRRAQEMRGVIAAAMSRSKREIPHYYLAQDVPLLRATHWLQEKNHSRPPAERVLLTALLLKAVAAALVRVPGFNGHWREDHFEPAEGIHLGVAISLRTGGLVAPALHDVPALGLGALSVALADLVKRTRAGQLRSSELADPTLTVTALGDQGVDQVFGIIHPPQVALVGFGRVAPRAWVTDDGIQAVPVVGATLSADHRATDGHQGALLLAEIMEQLQDPAALDSPGAPA